MIYSKIAAVKSEIGTLTKKSDNPFYKSKYLELSDLLEAVEPLLHANGLVLMQPIVNGEVRSEIYDIETGEVVISAIKLPEINDPQKLGSAITYFRRYTLQSLLSLQAVDDDANITVKQPVKKKPALDQAKFQEGIDAVSEGRLKMDKMLKALEAYELTDTQKKSIELFKKIG